MKRIVICAVLALGLFTTLTIIGIIDEQEPITAMSLAFDLFETGLLALAVAATAYVSVETREFRQERSDLIHNLAKATQEGAQWRATAQSHIDGLSHAIEEQFDRWRLSASESEIAGLMLKGLSHKEIARLRHTSEATIRQQATSVYKKSGLAGRTELAAFFLEDLLAPNAVASTKRANGSGNLALHSSQQT